MNLFELFAKITLDTGEYENQLGEAGEKTSGFAEKMRNGLATAAKVSAAAITAASSAAVALGKVAIENFGDYEQLAGGAQLMFGDAYDSVAERARNAYKKVQMSQNEYLQQVNGFATGLKTSLGGNEQAAADLADKILTAEADVVAATGNSQEAIQNAFNGIMKSNYTMLDNLQIGITPTKEGFQEVIDKVNEWNKTSADRTATNYTIDNLADCQSALVDYIEMVGMSGYASNEAAGTIQGSVTMMKAAWSNLLTGFADEDADLSELVSNVVESAGAVAQNVLPRVTMVMEGMGNAVQQVAPVLAKEVPAAISGILPSIIEAGAQLLIGLTNGLVSAIPQIAQKIPEIITAIKTAFSDNAASLAEAGGQMLTLIYNGLMNGIPYLANAAVAVMSQLGAYLQENIPTLLSEGLNAILQLSATIRKNAGLIVDGAIGLAKSLAQGLADSIPTIIENVPTIVSNIANTINDNAPKIFAAAVSIIGTLVKGLISAIPTIIANMPKIIAAIWDTITAINWVNLGSTVIKGLANGIKGMTGFAKQAVSDVGTTMKTKISELPAQFLNIGKNIIQGLINGIKSMASAVVGNIGGIMTSVVNGAKNVLGIHSPSKVFAGIGENMALGLNEGWESEYSNIKSNIENGLSFETGSLDFASSGLGVATSGIINNANASAQPGISDATFILQLEDGTKIASWLLSDLIKTAAANGTPIANPQMA